MSNKKRKTSEVVFDYTGTEEREAIPKDVTIVRFHSSVTEVSNDMFAHCKELKEVVFNDGYCRELRIMHFVNVHHWIISTFRLLY